MRLDVLKAMNAARRERRAGVTVTRLKDGDQRFVEASEFANDPMANILHTALRTGQSAAASFEGSDYFLTVSSPRRDLLSSAPCIFPRPWPRWRGLSASQRQ